ncbi:MAG: heterodisulfide reductase subunit F [Candidatus Omnitrophica bacterium CG11_big_fil_rev_8_21_14_0_20_43_6]|nr:MAG: heterodisulfide reductase subunit F [Candidatus Omnitrophica bacterium CG11_big_fil_rev_8_21_14_0_20_43_6]
MSQNIYLPNLAQIIEIKEETSDIKTFKLKFKDQAIEESFDYKPGQFVEFSVFGEGEAPFCISNSPTRKSGLECSVKRMGKVSQALHELNIGDTVGIRGPYGNGFPIDDLKNKHLLFVAGGIGLAPLRSLINYCLDKRGDFKEITIVNGARSSKDLVFKSEYEAWRGAKNTQLHLTVDCNEENWTCMVGVVPKILEQLKPTCQGSVAIVCGPPIMIKFTLPVLLKLGFCPEAIITTLEMKMKCGLGKCGRCNIGNLYICKDGPVFSYSQLKNINYDL